MNLAQQVARFPHLYGDLFPVVFDTGREHTVFGYDKEFRTRRFIYELFVLIPGKDQQIIDKLIPLDMALAIACWNGQQFGWSKEDVVQNIISHYKNVFWNVSGKVDTIRSYLESKKSISIVDLIRCNLLPLIEELKNREEKIPTLSYNSVRGRLLTGIPTEETLIVPKQNEK